jgi:hypothetical protein
MGGGVRNVHRQNGGHQRSDAVPALGDQGMKFNTEESPEGARDMAAYVIGLRRSAPRQTTWVKEYL